ncbi:hypothetical protein FOTG_14908 [Fusarium oxysporum f. sp. vasinfectum 25433]|uniref:Uncharacterized protein n=1 Tax=Fusarium oxysporum f. sp. vasinfectum 25433 TaxID=1089449 RepID=X0KTJ8_FUSOX|nr:hypothetical protein FOTG_14908 [Fusarium oxysporum f. sp. vasinfectum 25433]
MQSRYSTSRRSMRTRHFSASFQLVAVQLRRLLVWLVRVRDGEWAHIDHVA